MKYNYKNKIIYFLFIFILFLFAFSYFLYGYKFLHFRRFLYDEGITLYGAELILKGNIPYRDFWTLYPPGVFYLLAMGFKIFGINLAVQRMLSAIILALTTVSIFIFIQKLSSFIYAFIGFLLPLLWLKSYMVYLRPGQIALLFCILSSLGLLNFINTEKKSWIFISGIINGFVFLFRQDFWLYNFLAIIIFLMMKSQDDFQKIKEDFGFLVAGNLMVILPVLIYFISKNAFSDMFYDIFIFPLLVYPKVRDLPFPVLKLDTLIFYIPLFIFLFACIRILLSKKDKKFLFITFYLFLGMGLFFYTSIRTYISHLLPTMVPGIIIFILLLEEIINKFLIKKIIFKKIIITGILSLIIYLFFIEIKPIYLKEKQFEQNNDILKIKLRRANGFYDDPEFAQWQISAIQYIQERTEPEEKIFVGNVRHDKVVNNDILFYFLSERKSATKYFEIHPGLTNTYLVQKNIINDLKNNNVRYIVLWDDPFKMVEPNESNKSSGVFLLDNYIRENYEIIKVIGDYKILRRKNH